MGIKNEIERFDKRFFEEIIEIDAVTDSAGFGGGKGSSDLLWGASIDLIAWKLHSEEKITEEKYILETLVDDEGLKKIREVIHKDSIVRLKVSKCIDDSLNYFKLVEVIDASYKDSQLDKILKEYLKPVFYEDEVLGRMKLDNQFDSFQSDIKWINSDVSISLQNDDDEEIFKGYISTAHELYKNQQDWNRRILDYAAEELLDLANDWYKESREEYYDYFDPDFEEEDPFFKEEEVTKERFAGLIEISEFYVGSDGNFEAYCTDGDIFCGHSIIVSGNINGQFEEAQMAG